MTEVKILKGMREAVAYAKGEPTEGTRESWYDPCKEKWRLRIFENGKWIEKE